MWFAAIMLSGSTCNFNSPPQSDLGIWPNQKYSEIYMHPHIHIAPRCGLRQMSTDSLSRITSSVQRFQWRSLSPLRLFEMSLHKPIYSIFPNINNIGNLSVLDCILHLAQSFRALASHLVKILSNSPSSSGAMHDFFLDTRNVELHIHYFVSSFHQRSRKWPRF